MSGIIPVNDALTVSSAGTAIQATADTAIKPTSIYFEAHKDNTDVIYIGLANVDGDNYMACLEAGKGFCLTSDGAESLKSSAGIKLSEIWIDAGDDDQIVQMTYMQAIGN